MKIWTATEEHHFLVFVVIFGFYVQRVDAIDPALRRSGRFDAEIEVTTPREEERFQILKVRFIFSCLSWSDRLVVKFMNSRLVPIFSKSYLIAS